MQEGDAARELRDGGAHAAQLDKGEHGERERRGLL
jgi:hypothetical protein